MNRGTRITVVQPVVPAYREDFFERLSVRFGERFRVHHSHIDMGALTRRKRWRWSESLGAIRPLAGGALDWQAGALSIPIARGDTLVVSGNPRTLSTLALIVKARLKGARAIWWGQYWSSTSAPHRFILRLLLMRLAHAVLFYTDEEVALYRRTVLGRRDRRPIAALNNGIDIEPVLARRAAYDPATRENAALFIGRLTEKAALDVMIRAMALSPLASVSLHVIGDGEKGASLRALAGQLGVAERIIWHGATTDEQAIAAVANRCRLFVYPGSVGLSLIHAMAYGLPPVVHSDRWRHMPEISAHASSDTGYFFQPGNAADLAVVMGEAITAFHALAKQSRSCTDIVESKFNTGSMAERFSAAVIVA